MPSPADLQDRYHVSATDLAEATGASLRTVRKWQANDEITIQERFMTRLAALDSVLDELNDFSPSFVQAWLREPKENLDGLAPRQALGAGRWEDVLHQARLTRAGAAPKRPAASTAADDSATFDLPAAGETRSDSG